MKITRDLRMRQCGATDVPLSFVDAVFQFCFIDCDCEIEYSAEVFKSFPKAKVMHEGILVDGYTIPHRLLKQTAYRPYSMVW